MPLSRRPRRRAGSKPESFASRRRQQSASRGTPAEQRWGLKSGSEIESPEDNRTFDEDFWREQRPPHWG